MGVACALSAEDYLKGHTKTQLVQAAAACLLGMLALVDREALTTMAGKGVTAWREG